MKLLRHRYAIIVGIFLVSGLWLVWNPLPVFRFPSDSQSARDVAAADAVIWFILSILAVLTLIFGFWAYRIWQRTTRPDPAKKFADEVYHEVRETGEIQTEEPTTKESWERDPDWWKKQS
jgi:NADH:ubiquinone oxidoreductase subunit 5 (subunit L)/multisubunit Na+/H+ antiporter MnhA subunit